MLTENGESRPDNVGERIAEEEANSSDRLASSFCDEAKRGQSGSDSTAASTHDCPLLLLDAIELLS